MRSRLIRLVAGTEFGVMSTLLFVGLYTWPLLTFDKPGSTFRFIFVAWMAHVALIALSGFLSGRPGTDEHDEVAEPTDPTAP